jgi:hypothetical protein
MDYEALLPISLIRSHTKTDDVPSVTDELLDLYREAAFEAAKIYAGFELSPDGYTTQTVPKSDAVNLYIRLKRPAVDGVVVVEDGSTVSVANVAPGSQELRLNLLPSIFDAVDGWSGPKSFTSNCCGTQVDLGTDALTIRYKSHDGSPLKVPSGIKMGLLQYIAWAIENPGDVSAGGYEASVSAGALPIAAIRTFRRHKTELMF